MDVRPLATFDHRHHGFDLRSAAISRAIEPHLHESTVSAGRQLGGGPAVPGGNDRPHAVLVARELVIGFGIVTGIGRQLGELHDPQRLGQQRAELVDIGPRTATGMRGENEMVVGTTHQAQLGVMMINHDFPRFSHATAAADEVAARTTAVPSSHVRLFS